MIIGVPKEIKNNENRVALTPSGVKTLVQDGHQVFVEANAGEGAGFSDVLYQEAGGNVLPSASEVFVASKLIVKVKEPLPSEYKYITSAHIVFTYFHFASSFELTGAMLKSNATCIAYETIRDKDGKLPLLLPMSQVAGKLASQIGASYLLKHNGGKGKLIGGVGGVSPANVMVLGAGVVGTEAAYVAAGMGANVTLLDISLKRINELEKIVPKNIQLLFSSQSTINTLVKNADIIIGAVLIPGGKAPVLISKEMLNNIEKGTVIVDVAVDQGGCIETAKITSHDDPIYNEKGVLHYGVPNMPGAVPRTSTLALTNATFTYIRKLANLGVDELMTIDEGFAEGVSILKGEVLDNEVKKVFNI